ncbi:MAG TPA: TspO/MBR family protein [Acidobacteriota bacterium]|nr:TspO/MBR family protein [Acidobacteriota bacterium]
MSNTVKLIIAIIVPQAVGIISGLLTASGTREWYSTLTKPAFNPPAWVFGPVWTVLYLMMGVAAFLVWKKGLEEPGVKMAMLLFLVQLGLNAVWPLLFFGIHAPGIAFAEILILWAAIGATLIAFGAQNIVAGALLVPYLAWVSFAAVLNFWLWRLNS